MKKIECFISGRKLPELEQALRAWGIHGMTVSEVKGFGNEQTRPESFLFLPKTKAEVFCEDEQVEAIIELICSVCRTGKIGDGKIAIYEVQDLVRIRTGERGVAAV